jgi:hypothetical protein
MHLVLIDHFPILSYLLRKNQQMTWSDCECKTYLQPTAPTFDVIPSSGDRLSVAAPHIATISNDGVYYRRPSRDEGYSVLKLERYVFYYDG